MSNINEAVLATPTFTGTEAEITDALNKWTNLINTLEYSLSMSQENFNAFIMAFDKVVDSKIPTALRAADVVQDRDDYEQEVAAQCDTGVQSMTYSFAVPQTESLKESKTAQEIRRMRELAGIPHEGNRV